MQIYKYILSRIATLNRQSWPQLTYYVWPMAFPRQTTAAIRMHDPCPLRKQGVPRLHPEGPNGAHHSKVYLLYHGAYSPHQKNKLDCSLCSIPWRSELCTRCQAEFRCQNSMQKGHDRSLSHRSNLVLEEGSMRDGIQWVQVEGCRYLPLGGKALDSLVRFVHLEKPRWHTMWRSHRKASPRFGAMTTWCMSTETANRELHTASRTENCVGAEQMPCIGGNSSWRIECPHSTSNHGVFEFPMSEWCWIGHRMVEQQSRRRNVTVSSGVIASCR